MRTNLLLRPDPASMDRSHPRRIRSGGFAVPRLWLSQGERVESVGGTDRVTPSAAGRDTSGGRPPLGGAGGPTVRGRVAAYGRCMNRFASYLRRHHIALLALFVALGGTSYAAVALPANSVGVKQIKKSAVNRAKLRANAVDSTRVRDGS